ncbi:hypothetical protein BBR47_11430 [Brevibacillus brevis NBRC 100599]|uniref:Uncharacterized protein n=1 Tax=Brevibacillus brevis (strain 47 / JCM 6285 / NBRC 100599) TaxID=358681 RepID=C0Z6G3_BREBN|nr:hypothetical protein BBR47_11430 [Brevibacillus brevis NBRC 100599]
MAIIFFATRRLEDDFFLGGFEIVTNRFDFL